jgi:hypothetical protein
MNNQHTSSGFPNTADIIDSRVGRPVSVTRKGSNTPVDGVLTKNGEEYSLANSTITFKLDQVFSWQLVVGHLDITITALP